MPTYCGVGGVARKLKEWPVGIDGIVRQQKEVWAGVNGVSKQIFSSGPALLLTWDIPVALNNQNSAIYVNGAAVFEYDSASTYSGECSIKNGDTISVQYGRTGTLGTKRIYFNSVVVVEETTRGSINYSFSVSGKSISITANPWSALLDIMEVDPV